MFIDSQIIYFAILTLRLRCYDRLQLTVISELSRLKHINVPSCLYFCLVLIGLHKDENENTELEILCCSLFESWPKVLIVLKMVHFSPQHQGM